jgi:CRISPR-associated protein Csb2
LGRSESVCSARLIEREEPAEPDASPLERWRGSVEVELVELLCPEGLEALTASVGDLRRQRLLLPPGARLIEYAVCAPPPSVLPRARPVEPPTLALYRLAGGARPGIRDAVAVAEAVRAALQGRYGAIHAGAASSIFSGRDANGFRRDDHRHAHYLALPDEQGRRVDHVAVWAREGFGHGEIEALAALRELRADWLREPVRVALVALGHPAAIRFSRLLGPARRWHSVTPFGLPRHPKRRSGRVVEGPVEQIRRELTRRGYPLPQRIELIRGPWLEYRRTRIRVSRRDAVQVVGAEILFPEPVSGPLAIGALSHFGLGLFAPREEE